MQQKEMQTLQTIDGKSKSLTPYSARPEYAKFAQYLHIPLNAKHWRSTPDVNQTGIMI